MKVVPLRDISYLITDVNPTDVSLKEFANTIAIL
jgi:hypothetical protein